MRQHAEYHVLLTVNVFADIISGFHYELTPLTLTS
jgi:hypothetical protein